MYYDKKEITMSATMCKGLAAKTFDHLKDLKGISQEQLDQHYKLYNGYVANMTKIMENLEKLDVGSQEWNEVKRRFGFEVNGVVLHELYFDNMKPHGGELPVSSKLMTAINESYGSYDAWLADFKATGKMRGIGWVITYQCSRMGHLVNVWVSDHENGHPPGYTPILVMDVWEHAFTVDYKPTEKGSYIDAFFNNINWSEAESRLRA